jgi:diguanylate cyclase (GGDEF)-like protein/PAS domain S-box-containing protein
MPPATPIAYETDPEIIAARLRSEQRLRESEARYRLLAENSTDVVALLAADGTRVYVSPSCFALTGYTPEEMQAMRTGDSTHPEDAERVLAVLANRSAESTVTYRMRRKDGSYVWVETTCKPLHGPGRDDLRVAIVRNVDDRIRADLLLHESEARYRFLAENTGDLIILVGPDGKRLYVSKACMDLLGYTQQEMLAMNSRETLHPDDADRVLSTLASKNRAQSDLTTSYRMRRKDGSFVWVETAGRSVSIGDQKHLRLVIVRDIEQRRLAEQQLKDSEARYRLLAENSSDIVFQLDRDLVRRYVSPACRELLGYEPEELVGVKPVEMAHPDDAPRLALIFQTLLSGGAERQSIVNRIRHRDGKWIWVEARFRALKDSETGAITGIIGALRDISARKAIEDELAGANRRLQILATQDGLTGLANRRAFDEALAREHLRARREKTRLALIMIDVDHFKAFNDLYGHQAGDDCLRRVCGAITATICRPGDLAARYGGEEFAVLLPNTDEDGAGVIAERISQAVLGLAIPHDANANAVVTISGGVASIDGAEGTPEALVRDADRALYRAKDFGRNAVIRATEVAPARAELHA